MPTPFENAVKESNKKLVHDLLSGSRPLPIDIRNEASQTGLMIACAFKAKETAEEILAKYQELENHTIEVTDALGWTALHYAAQNGSLECVQLLIEYKANINATTNKNETALFLATTRNHLDIVEYLAENNCMLQTKAVFKKLEILSTNEEYTALFVAVRKNFVEIAKCLLSHLTRSKGLSEKELNQLLVKAVKKDHAKVATELLINGACVNTHEGTLIGFKRCFKNAVSNN
jgi:ankyrin repeat protein